MTDLFSAQTLDLREKLATIGAEKLSDTELLAIFISSGNGKRSCLQLAQDLLRMFGDLRAIINADKHSFQRIPGLGLVKYSQLQAAREICLRSEFITLKKELQLNNTQQTYRYIKRQLRDRKNEIFAALFLDSQHRVIAYEELFQGTINAATIHPRPLVDRALKLNAAAIILAHNHPSGLCEASQQDYRVTERLSQALSLIDVQLLDHIVIGDNEVFSILEQRKRICH
ncbi:DNA repair protein RadC [Legionella birminghamensis]|uniref:DNA repair protein RadC n=1 Tax=Legionella birminghamensis TaxID=28083 RepID=A0A378ILD8_9GAMM|nr:DNA repair protein RadC [Legionella birminghamensis]KTC66784.1 DNA repair protein RadC [Legionella birminghamensis]STX32934.1 DNA repair protein RadC [Legionella birminghamensis]